MSASVEKFYLGDAVFGFYDPSGCLVLQTEDGYNITNRIYLDVEVQEALFAKMQEKLVADYDACRAAGRHVCGPPTERG